MIGVYGLKMSDPLGGASPVIELISPCSFPIYLYVALSIDAAETACLTYAQR